jgi:hypothetical protein
MAVKLLGLWMCGVLSMHALAGCGGGGDGDEDGISDGDADGDVGIPIH